MPPTPLTLHILLALARNDQTGAHISEQIAIDSRSALLVRESSLYRALHQLTADGYIAVSPISRPHRTTYTLTHRGRQILRREKSRISEMASLMHERVA